MANSEHLQWLKEGVQSWNDRRNRLHFRPDFDGANITALLKGPLYNPQGIPTDISLEGVNLENASLRGAYLSGIGFRGANFRFAQLSNSQLWLADFQDADLAFANLEGAELLKINLTGAYAGAANFCGANLNNACFTDTILASANLSRASLINANIEGTNLSKTNLVGANLTNTSPWKAVLFPESKDMACTYSSVPPEASNVQALIDFCTEVDRHYKQCQKGKDAAGHISLYFRGQSNSEWTLTPSVLRMGDDGTTLRNKEGEMLLELLSRRPEDFTEAPSALSQWVMAQHHGLRTRLLDVTKNPLVALFHCCDEEKRYNSGDQSGNDKDGIIHIFAVPRRMIKRFDSDAVSVISNFAKLERFEQDTILGRSVDHDDDGARTARGLDDNFHIIMQRLYNHIRNEKPHFGEWIDIRDLFRVFVVEPQQSFERIRVQSGAFIVSAFHENLGVDAILSRVRGNPIYDHYQVTVPRKRKGALLHQLRIMNVTREVLFPGLVETAKAIAEAGRGD